MNDDRSQTAAADAEPAPVNPQVTDSVEDTGTQTELGAIPSSYGAAGSTAGDEEAGDGESREGG